MSTNEAPHAFLEFFRRDLGDTSKRILVPAGILVFVGAPGVCFGAAVKGNGALHLEIGIAGAIILLTGLGLGFIGMARLVRHDAYVAVVEKGLLLHLEHGDELHPWADVRAITATDVGIAVALVDDAKHVEVVGHFGGLSHQALADRLEDWRRKSSFNLKPSDPPGK